MNATWSWRSNSTASTIWCGASAVLGNKGYTAKNKYLPLPQEQVDASNGVLVQNPDYAN